MRCAGPVLFGLLAGSNSLAADRQAMAEEVFKNIQMFKGKPAARVIPAMDALTGLLGVDCAYCHVQREWEKEDKPNKQTARKMFEMMGYLNETYFDGKNRLSCWTCHRGHGKPPAPAADAQRTALAKQLMAVPVADEGRPGEQVFKNIRSLAGVPAGRFPGIMAYFSGALGVECSHCHVAGHWEQDTPAKLTARKMLTMVTATVNKYYGGQGPLGCPDCHQGNVSPQFMPEAQK
jgi:Photosynthetic reaction centre cytochrome C subunit